MLRYIANTIWALLFDKEADSLERYVNYRNHPITGTPITDYIIIDNNPIFKYHNRNDTFLTNFFAGIIKGILCYSGFDCDVKIMNEEQKDKLNQKAEFLVLFELDILDRDNS